MIATLCTFLSLLATPILGQYSQLIAPPSPCPTVFTYDQPGPELGWWSGVVNLSTDSLLNSLWLDIVLDNKTLKLLHRTVEVFTQDFINFRIEDEDMQIQPGIQTSLRFSVQYDTNDEVPRVQTIRLNGIIICNALTAEEQTDSRLKTNINSNIRVVINPSQQSIYPVNPRHVNRSDPGNIYKTGDNFSGRGEQAQCGTSSLMSEWPWVVAVYRFLNSKHEYSCGGTLLSHRHVVTSTRAVINENKLVVYLGKHNLSSVLGVQIRLVQEIIVSPDYTEITKFAHFGQDLALLLLHEPVTYTDWVRPVCLWPAHKIDLDRVIGKKGSLVGWGYDEKRDVVETLNKVEMLVINQDTCSESKDDYALKESNNYYCAGNSEDTVLCRVIDLGNGMVFQMGNSWYLRGHVSFILKTNFKCDPTRYFQFTDVAKSVPWIHDIVSNYL